MRYMIHAAPARMWYVYQFLVPSMRAQGIDDIEIWCDTDGIGNLFSCMESFKACAGNRGGVWHLQDDVIISRNFAERTRGDPAEPVACGFGCQNFGPSMEQRGRVPACFMWYSFQCQYLSNELAGEFTEWFYSDAMHRTAYSTQVVDRRHDDWFFREFIMERHKDLWIQNIAPNLVDHVDYLIGGTLINRLRRIQVNRAAFFDDLDLVDELEQKLKSR